jgi:Cft2 family RNA processing exonuclease
VTFQDTLEDLENKKTKDLFMTPQRKDEKLRKEILDIRLSKTDDIKKPISLDLKLSSNFPFRTGLFSACIDK